MPTKKWEPSNISQKAKVRRADSQGGLGQPGWVVMCGNHQFGWDPPAHPSRVSLRSPLRFAHRPRFATRPPQYDRLVNNSQPVPSLNISPDDCSILPYTHYIKSVPKTDVEMKRWRAAKSRAKERKEVVEEELKKGELTSLLDGFALLEGCGVDLPDKGRRADVSGKGFGGVVEEVREITILFVLYFS